MKLPYILTLLLVVCTVAGCCNPPKASKEYTTNSVARDSVERVVPVKEQKNDPDHIYFLCADDVVVSQVWTNASE